MNGTVFRDRVEAGRLLGEQLSHQGPFDKGLVLALPRGGVPVAFQVAQKLALPLDLMLVRKLGVPGHEELAMGAVASGGAVVFNDDLLRQLPIGDDTIDRVTSKERQELKRREELYRGERPKPAIAGRPVILVDDGLATGSTMRAAITALRQFKPARVIVAVGVAPPDTAAALRREADDVVCLSTPDQFMGVGRWYQDFSQTTDQEVRDLLSRAWSSQAKSH